MPYAIFRPRMAAIRTDAACQPMCRSSCIARCLIGRIEDVALARVNLARDAGDEHIASLTAHRAFERRNQIAVVVFMRQRVALVGEMPRIATMLGSVFRCDDAAIIDQFVEGDGLDGYRRSEEHTSELQSLMR